MGLGLGLGAGLGLDLGRHPADGGRVRARALVHGLQPVARRLAALADEHQVGLGEAREDVALRDALG